MSMAKSMNRSRNQLSTAYAPGSFFTFEGGVGACVATSIAGEEAVLRDATRRMIYERMEQFCEAWFSRAMRSREHNDVQKSKSPVLPELCVDVGLLDDEHAKVRIPSIEDLYFSKPSNMGYTPAPLTFTCRYCELFREYSSLKDMAKDLQRLKAHTCTSAKSPTGTCSWEQLDVIFVHWSGAWAQGSPHLWNFRDGRAALDYARCVTCDSQEFKLNRSSPKIGDWFFYCADPKCGARWRDRWMQRDRDTLEILRTPVGQGRLDGPTEINMEATPYRATNAYHVQTDIFIDFQKNDDQLLQLLSSESEEGLRAFIAQRYGYEISPITEEDVERAFKQNPHLADTEARYRIAQAGIKDLSEVLKGASDALRAALEQPLKAAKLAREEILQKLKDDRILVSKTELPNSVATALTYRRELFDRRYDPFQLAVEHQMLKQARLEVAEEEGGQRKYVSFKRLDKDLQPESDEEKIELEQAADQRLADLGVSDMGLIRQFDLCRFSFAYTRISSEPVLPNKRFMNMPVRLRLFEPVTHDERSKYPIYVVQQANQAIYVRLDEGRVLRWLQSLQCADPIALSNGQSLGAGLLERTLPMNRFLDGLPKASDAPHSYRYLYTLLHSYAHHVIRQVSAYSGLDVGSLGEYLFPADLAFVIYRNGTTMDLGNLSAMWRNSGKAMLDALLDPKSLQCGTGSLCTSRGSSCPDCLMIPEVSCIASNKLLSRSVLRSIGGRPSFDTRLQPIAGYLDWKQAG